MQSSCASDAMNEIKTQLITREGVYRLIPGAEYSRPKPSSYGPLQATLNGCNGTVTAAPVRMSFTQTVVSRQQSSIGSKNCANIDPFSSSQTSSIGYSSAGKMQRYNYETSTSSNSNSASLQRNNAAARHSLQNSLSSTQSSPSNSGRGQVPPVNRDAIDNTDDNDEILEERICFNIGREIFIYSFNGLQTAESTKLLDRRTYKATAPTAHDFCNCSDPRVALLLIGFNAGQIQLIDLNNSIETKFFNQERLIDKTKVTCIRWLPKSRSNFLVSYASGHMYLFREDLVCGTGSAPHYTLFKSGEGFTISTQKNKHSRNPIFKWSLGEFNAAGGLAINEFSFSPCGEYLGIVSQDGYLRVFHYDRMELVGTMRSYFGGLLCLAWSADSALIATGGEDDLITIWSLTDACVVARGQGHKSWVNVVQFDPFITKIRSFDEDDSGNGYESSTGGYRRSAPTTGHGCYRLCSVGQDTQLCLWDLTDDCIKSAQRFHHSPPASELNGNAYGSQDLQNFSNNKHSTPLTESTNNISTTEHTNGGSGTKVSSNSHSSHNKFFNSLIKNKSKEGKSSKSSGLTTSGHVQHEKKSKEHHNLSQTHNNQNGNHSDSKSVDLQRRQLGSSSCPKLDKVAMLEPHLCKKVSNERLTALAFRSDYFVIANQDGKISLYSRPRNLEDRFPSGNASIASDCLLMGADDMTICDDDNSDAM